MRATLLVCCAGAMVVGAGCKGSALATDEQALTVHEWGTYTSMVGSGGAMLAGLHHEEEALPAFVHSRASVPTTMKGLEAVPDGVTQKLETPVLYFYTKAAQAVSVRVGFPDGVISQWYPAAAEMAPAVGAMNGQVAGGAMTWRGQLLPGASGFPDVAPTDIWAPSRTGMSVPVDVAGEREQFIFYRGLGAFSVPFSTVANADGTLTIHNGSTDDVPAVFLLRLHPAGGFIAELGPLAAGQTLGGIAAPAAGKERNVDQYVADASTQVAGALVRSGLTAEEARAMVDTWSRSYFRTPGLRVLYVAPRAWTDRLLPIEIQPAPRELVRTLVGRVELLTPPDEAALMTQLRAAATAQTATTELLGSLGRFAEPKLRRGADLAGGDATLAAYLATAIAQAHTAP